MRARIERSVLKSVRQPREGDSRAHIAFIKSLPCILCGRSGVDPHHLLRINDGAPKGTGRTNPDRWALPACRLHHDAMHDAGNDEAFLAKQGYDGRGLATSLWSNTGDLDACLRIVERAKQAAGLKADKPKPVDPRDPDYSREGIFQDHNCWKCNSGERPCVKGGNPAKCEYLHARND